MNITTNQAAKRVLVVILIVVGLFAGIKIYRTDIFQKRFYPGKYWANKVVLAEESVETFTIMLLSSRRDLDRLIQDKGFEIRSRKPIGIKEPEASRLALEQYYQDLENERYNIREYANILDSFRNDLIEARFELSLVRKTTSPTIPHLTEEEKQQQADKIYDAAIKEYLKERGE